MKGKFWNKVMRENEREAVSIYLCIFAKIERTKEQKE